MSYHFKELKHLDYNCRMGAQNLIPYKVEGTSEEEILYNRW